MKYIKNNYFSDRVLKSDIKKYFDDDKNCKYAFDYIKNLYYKYPKFIVFFYVYFVRNLI